MTIGFLLSNDRAARMVAQSAIDPSLPGLDDVIDRVINATVDLKTTAAYEAEIERAIQRVVVSHLMQLANGAQMSQGGEIAGATLKAIHARMGQAAPKTAPINASESAPRQMLASDISRFFTGPGDQATRIISVPTLPPGAPIDSPMDYLLGLDLECLRIR